MIFRALLAVLSFAGAISFAAEYDLVLRHGRVVDGTGNAARFADVAVKDGRIVLVGRLAGSATNELDARGLIVAPGFIDVHTHAEDIDDLPRGENFMRMGVTTLVLGNCGGSVERWRLLSQGEATNVSPDIATQIGHGTVARVRWAVTDRPPTAAELEAMKESVEQAMKDGAVGLSTGLIYLPGTFAKTDEIVELAKVAAKYDGIYASHMRSESAEIFQALNELFQISREGGLRAHVSHIKSANQLGADGQGHRGDRLHARAGGLDITQDHWVSASSTYRDPIPQKYREGESSPRTTRMRQRRRMGRT
jgi:N-acyl-D-amino-acid deacylase